jgi:hypothetical protein
MLSSGIRVGAWNYIHMSLPTLNYIERQRGRDLQIIFRKIYSSSSGTRENQATEKKGISIKPPADSGIPPKIKELLGSGLLENPIIQPGNDDSGIPPLKGKGLLGLLDENNPTIQ